MRRKKHKKTIMPVLFLILFMIVSYAAFETEINLKAKGNIYDKVDLCYETATNIDGTLTITNYDETCGVSVNIPKIIKGKIVTKIGDSAFEHKKIKTLKLPDTLTSIGMSAFQRNEIEEVEIPPKITRISSYAFKANKLTYLKLNDGLKQIGMDAFMSNNLTEVNLPKTVQSLEGGTFASNNLTGDEAYIYGINPDGSINYTHLDSYAGKNATGTKIPETVKTLGLEAYANVRYDEIDVPESIKEIPGYCFNNTYANKITLHEGLEKINAAAFGATKITEITIPSSVT